MCTAPSGRLWNLFTREVRQGKHDGKTIAWVSPEQTIMIHVTTMPQELDRLIARATVARRRWQYLVVVDPRTHQRRELLLEFDHPSATREENSIVMAEEHTEIAAEHAGEHDSLALGGRSVSRKLEPPFLDITMEQLRAMALKALRLPSGLLAPQACQGTPTDPAILERHQARIDAQGSVYYQAPTPTKDMLALRAAYHTDLGFLGTYLAEQAEGKRHVTLRAWILDSHSYAATARAILERAIEPGLANASHSAITLECLTPVRLGTTRYTIAKDTSGQIVEVKARHNILLGRQQPLLMASQRNLAFDGWLSASVQQQVLEACGAVDADYDKLRAVHRAMACGLEAIPEAATYLAGTQSLYQGALKRLSRQRRDYGDWRDQLPKHSARGGLCAHCLAPAKHQVFLLSHEHFYVCAQHLGAWQALDVVTAHHVLSDAEFNPIFLGMNARNYYEERVAQQQRFLDL